MDITLFVSFLEAFLYSYYALRITLQISMAEKGDQNGSSNTNEDLNMETHDNAPTMPALSELDARVQAAIMETITQQLQAQFRTATWAATTPAVEGDPGQASCPGRPREVARTPAPTGDLKATHCSSVRLTQVLEPYTGIGVQSHSRRTELAFS